MGEMLSGGSYSRRRRRTLLLGADGLIVHLTRARVSSIRSRVLPCRHRCCTLAIDA
jgi:hypothetical protein